MSRHSALFFFFLGATWSIAAMPFQLVGQDTLKPSRPFAFSLPYNLSTYLIRGKILETTNDYNALETSLFTFSVFKPSLDTSHCTFRIGKQMVFDSCIFLPKNSSADNHYYCKPYTQTPISITSMLGFTNCHFENQLNLSNLYMGKKASMYMNNCEGGSIQISDTKGFYTFTNMRLESSLAITSSEISNFNIVNTNFSDTDLVDIRLFGSKVTLATLFTDVKADRLFD